MTTTKTKFTVLALFLFGAIFAACGGGDDDDTDTDAGITEFICDPEGANPEMGMLLNAPVESDVEVIVKEAQHPGDPGPENLP